MTVIEYDLKATRIATKRCSPGIALAAILLMVIVAAFVGSMLYYHQLWPFATTREPEESQSRRNLVIALLKHNEEQFLVAPGEGGNPFGAVFNGSHQWDGLSLESVVGRIASYEFRMSMKPDGNRRNRPSYGERIVPDDIERQLWDAAVGSKFVMKIGYDGSRIALEYLHAVDLTSDGDRSEYEELFDTLMKFGSA